MTDIIHKVETEWRSTHNTALRTEGEIEIYKWRISFGVGGTSIGGEERYCLIF